MRALRVLAGGLCALLVAAAGPATPAGRSPFPGVPTLELLTGQAPKGSLVVRFMGTSTLLFDDGETRILIDGFFTRSETWNPFARIAPDPKAIDHAIRRAGIDRLDAILVAHSHHDHAMDSADVALLTGAELVGSRSTANIAVGRGLPRPRQTVEDRKAWTFGRFNITVIPSPHSPSLFGRPLFEGEIDAPLPQRPRMKAYREGGGYSFLIEHDGLRVLVHPSAGASPGQYRRHRADVVFLGIGSLGKQGGRFADRYWGEVVQTTQARLVIPIHWDDFTRPLTEPLRPTPWPFDRPQAGMKSVVERARNGPRLALMPLFDPVLVRPAIL
ncbi:MBL fold metallo-hydrolase [Caulobacter sp. SLTY]|uniref:MBL fold metallo-hydrolase n=1 Tax=Caulobacter sp. SLTY TaxID=2683262 RepID=UPI0014121198|nr:MBL fold metallo-hydrolase [Caulobacter sp. SLTY]NBB17432.1 MBL fold metallo-hydrolase [Caulobacter sp. SLTY]